MLMHVSLWLALDRGEGPNVGARQHGLEGGLSIAMAGASELLSDSFWLQEAGVELGKHCKAKC